MILFNDRAGKVEDDLKANENVDDDDCYQKKYKKKKMKKIRLKKKRKKKSVNDKI